MGRPSWNLSELLKRTISIIFIIPIVLLFVYLKGSFFVAIIIIAAVLMAFEWQNITASAKSNCKWQLLGVAYIAIPSISLFYLINFPEGEKIIYFLFVVVWCTDIGGYLFGKTIGGRKLAPSISPNKTWAGFFGGIFLAIIAGYYFEVLSVSYVVIISIAAQLGDLLESKIKRIYEFKDSGNLIPGHGGMLDAVDGLVIAAPILLLIISLKL